MSQYIDLEQLIVMFKTTYANSKLSGEEIARILEIRFSKQESKTYAQYRKDRGLAEE